MISNNQLALDDGRISKDQFDSMAAYKFITYGNDDDLDVNEDYSSYGLVKIAFASSKYLDRKVVSPYGLARSIYGDVIDNGCYKVDVLDDGYTLSVNSLYWVWAKDTSRCYINHLMMVEGLDPKDWDWDQAS